MKDKTPHAGRGQTPYTPVRVEIVSYAREDIMALSPDDQTGQGEWDKQNNTLWDLLMGGC